MKEQSCWIDSAPPWPGARQEIPDRIDVVVIGAGYGGLSAARTVARGGASVAVFDKGALGEGASGTNAGHVLAGLQRGARDLIRQFGVPRGRALFAASLHALAAFEQLIADERIACDYERTGHIEAAARASHFEGFKTEQELLAREFDYRVDLVPQSSQDGEVGSAHYHGLLVDPRSVAIHPLKYLHGLARAATAAGARLYEQTPVTRVTRQGVGFEVTAAGRKIVARDVIACTGGYTDRALHTLRRRVVPIGSYAIATEPLSDGVAATMIPRRRVVFDSRCLRYSFRLSPDNRLVFGGRVSFSLSTAASTRANAQVLRSGMIEVFPQLRDVRIDYAWSGNVDFTRDRLPHAGLVDGIHFAIGYGDRGVALSTYLGTRVGECLLGKQSDTPFHDVRFEPIPLHTGRSWFLPFATMYCRWMDRRR